MDFARASSEGKDFQVKNKKKTVVKMHNFLKIAKNTKYRLNIAKFEYLCVWKYPPLCSIRFYFITLTPASKRVLLFPVFLRNETSYQDGTCFVEISTQGFNTWAGTDDLLLFFLNVFWVLVVFEPLWPRSRAVAKFLYASGYLEVLATTTVSRTQLKVAA